MEKIYESPNWAIYWHIKGEVIHLVFTPNTSKISEKEYLDELKAFIPLVEKYKPKAILADTRNFGFVNSPDVQEWINENILALYAKIGVRKHAILISSDLFTAVAVEMTMDEDRSGTFQNQYFEDETLAKTWLLA